MKVNQISNMMNPLVLFDYVYYSVANFCSFVLNLDDEKRLGGMLFLSSFQMFNCLTLYIFLELEQFVNVEVTRLIVPVAIVLVILNYIRYYRYVSFNMLKDKWGEDKMYIKIMKIAFVVCYILITYTIIGFITK